MIVTVPVLYRATIVRLGCRKPEDCLLRTSVPVRIPEGEPPLAILREADTSTYGPEGIPIHPAMHSRTARWYAHDGQLLGEFSDVLKAYRVRSPLEPNETEGSAALRQCLMPIPAGQTIWIGRDRTETHPFFCEEAIRRPATAADGYMPDGGSIDIHEESIETRSRVLLNPNARDLAISYAQRAAAGRVFHVGARELLVPSIGPVILGSNRPISALSVATRNMKCGHAFSALEMNEAMAFSAKIHEGILNLRPLERLTVLRPDLVTWDSAAATLASLGGQLGLARHTYQEREAGVRSIMGAGVISNASKLIEVLLQGSGVSQEAVNARRHLFENCRTPSREALELSHWVVSAALEHLHAKSLDFTGGIPSVDVHAIFKLNHLLERTRHLGLGLDAEAMMAAGMTPQLVPGQRL